MEITDEQFEEIKKKFTVHNCSLCGTARWFFAPTLFEAGLYHDKFNFQEYSCIPFLIMTCSNCGKMHFLNALALGIVDGNDDV